MSSVTATDIRLALECYHKMEQDADVWLTHGAPSLGKRELIITYIAEAISQVRNNAEMLSSLRQRIEKLEHA